MSIYVALEGIEGTGKSTLARLLADALTQDGQEVLTVREPGGTPAAEAIRHVLLSPDYEVEPWAEALLFAAQRAQLAAEMIRPALEKGFIVIGDRSVYSSLAYQGIGRGLGLDAVRTVNEAGLAGTWPDLVIWMVLDAETGLAREDVEDRISAEGSEFLEVVADAYRQLAGAEPDRFAMIDAGRSIAQVAADALTLIRDKL